MNNAELFDAAFKILQLVVIVGGAGGILFRVGRAVSRFEVIGKIQSAEISELKSEVKALSAVITTVAVQKVELSSMRADISRLSAWYDELRHGQGFIRQS